MDLFLDSYATK